MAETESDKRVGGWPRFLFCLDQSFFFSYWVLSSLLLVCTSRIWRMANSVPDIAEPPFPKQFRQETDLAFATSLIFLLWSILSLVPHFIYYHRRNYYLVLTAIRWGITLLLGVCVGVQTLYIPRPLGTCDTYQPFSTLWWSLPDTMLHQKHGPDVPLYPCELVVMVTWRYEIFVACWMFLCGVNSMYIYFHHERAWSQQVNTASDAGALRRACAPRIRYMLAKRQRKRARQSSVHPARSGTWGSHLLRRQGFTPLNPGNAYYEMGEWPPAIEVASARECPCYGKNNKDNKCWACQAQNCIDCRMITSRRRPVRPHQSCKVLCGKCFYERCCVVSTKVPWTKPYTCTHHGDAEKEERDPRDDDVLVDLSLCRNTCGKLTKERLFELREMQERNGQAEPYLVILKCDQCGQSCRKGDKVDQVYFFACPRCNGQCMSDVHDCQ